MLRLEGYQVRTAMNAETGLREAERTASPTPSSSTCGCRWSTAWASCAACAPNDQHRDTPVAIVTGDYFLDDAVSAELRELGAELRFKPLWLEDLVGLARTPRSRGDALTDSAVAIPQSLPARAGRRDAGLVHAPGRAAT